MAPRYSSCFTESLNRASFELRREHKDSSPFLTSISVSLRSWNRRLRPPLLLRHRTPLASRVVHWVSVHLSSCIWNLRLFPDDATGVSVPLHVVAASPGLHSKRFPGIRTYFEWTGKSVSFRMWHEPRGFLSSFNVRPASS